MSATAPESTGLSVGDERTVDIGPIAHGGHFIAHSDGRTLFVRHALTGERVRVRITEVNRRIVRADAIEILSPAAARVLPPCSWAHAGGCGGCDFQHVALDEQLTLKTQVLREALQRFAGVADSDVLVEPLPGFDDGLHWRSRMRWGTDAQGSLGLRRHRSHALVPVDSCLLAAAGIDAPDLRPAVPPDTSEVIAAVGSEGEVSIVADGKLVRGPAVLRQTVGGHEWRVRPTSFWQVHPALAGTLSDEVRTRSGAAAGQSWLDLYAGAGLFSAVLADAVGEQGRVDAVESAPDSVREARRALHDVKSVRLHQTDVESWLRTRDSSLRPDGVVLDPPRSGAGPAVVTAIADRSVPTVVYVACDPVALARDLALFSARGYRLESVRAFDAFPMTHHFESVARLVTGSS